MKINKQLFEDVLSGKLKGKFIFRNTCNIYGVELKPNHTCIEKASKKDFYIIRMPDMLFNVVDSNGKSVYCCVKHKEETENDPNSDIIDFIPNTNMKENELKIKIPENHEIDWQESAKQEKIVFKNINTKPKSWEEYLRSGNHPNKLWFINPAYKSTGGIESTGGDIKDFNLNKSGCCMSAYLPSRELTEAFLAMMQLMSLRQAWIDDWEPNWSNFDNSKWGIINHANKLTISLFGNSSRPLSFPTKEMAEDFMSCFKDLLEIAKPLI